MTATERHRTGHEATELRALCRPEWAAYWPPRALTMDEWKQLDLDLEMLAWADSRPGGQRSVAYETALADALDRADLHGWRRHLLLAIQARLG